MSSGSLHEGLGCDSCYSHFQSSKLRNCGRKRVLVYVVLRVQSVAFKVSGMQLSSELM